jgi:hypothetical protein
MTAEVAVLNRQAIALAADSAVTINYAGGQRKIFNSVSKLFTLSKRAPVGVMVYGGAELTGIPWETIIKSFRRELGDTRKPRLRDYAEELIAYIKDHKVMFSEDLQKKQVLTSVLLQFRAILRVIDKRIDDEIAAKGPIAEGRIRQIINKAVRDAQHGWNNAPTLPGAPTNHAARLRRKYRSEIDTVIDTVFEKLPIGATARTRLVDIAGLVFTTALFPDNVSGVVVAGFGEEDYFPSLVSFDMEGVLLNYVKVRESPGRSSTITGDTDSAIMAFAQGEMVNLFMEGVDPGFRDEIHTQLRGLLSSLPDELVRLLGAADVEEKRLRTEFAKAAAGLEAEFRKALEFYSALRHIKPVVDAVANLPKEELAGMAETLVNLTSFKRRVTQDPETVGGPIDVAVISKGDGFIWIQRKHYFEPGLNHQFFDNYYFAAGQKP